MEQIKELVETFQFSSELWVILLPLILIVLDILTGITNAFLKGEIKSSKLREGLAKKIGEITVIAIGEIFGLAFNLSSVIAAGISIYISLMELISVCENLEKMNVPIPKFIKKALYIVNQNINEEPEDKNV